MRSSVTSLPRHAEPVDLAAVADALPNSDARCGSLRALVSAVVVRGAYGGMAGDVRLLRAAAQWWLTRLRHLPEPGARDSAPVRGPHANAVAGSPTPPSSGGVPNVAQPPPGGQVGTSSEATVMGSGRAAAGASLSAQPSAMRWEALFQHEPHKFQVRPTSDTVRTHAPRACSCVVFAKLKHR